MGNVSMFGYQSNNPSARLAYDLCILNELDSEKEKNDIKDGDDDEDE